ncbi:MAG: Na+/H+ antiporter subunit E [Anaerolineae bacterium]|nr:Na+/H+ antiporter subunit E [Anaerolineae bacterium]
MTTFLLNILLALAWVALTGEFTPLNLLIGFALGLLALWVTRRNGGRPRYVGKLFVILNFTLFFIKELVVANLRMAALSFKPHNRLRPAIVAVPLDVNSDLEITLLANLITLTPGTLALDVSDDRQILYVHVADIRESPDSVRQNIKRGFERRVKELFT